MARMCHSAADKEEMGPYPHHIGDYCGNYHPDWIPIPLLHESMEDAYRSQRDHLARMRLGLPRPCNGKTTAQLYAEGWRGLYIAVESPLMPWERAVPTPPELREPQINLEIDRAVLDEYLATLAEED